jgi:cytochrome c peroxidase
MSGAVARDGRGVAVLTGVVAVATALGCAGTVPSTTPAPAADAGAGAGGGGGTAPPAQTEVEGARALLAAQALDDAAAAPADPTNRFADDPRAAALGQRLFFDPGFSGQLIDEDNNGSVATLGLKGETGKVACIGCHVPGAGFLDNRSPRAQIPLGAGWGLRRARPLLDVAQAKLLMWDGHRDALWNQVFTPLESPVEMNSARLFVAQEIYRRYRGDYEALFGPLPPLADGGRFPTLTAAQAGCHEAPAGSGVLECHGKPGDGAEFDGLAAEDKDLVTRVVVNMGKAIAAYERRLGCGPGRFDRWARGDRAALTEQEQHGAVVFARVGCSRCHAGPYFTDQRFHNVGLAPVPVVVAFIDRDDRGAALGLRRLLDDPTNTRSAFSDGDDGRLPQAVGPETEGAFRTPSLRCVATRPSFMHTGQYRALTDTIQFFNRGGDSEGFPGTSEVEPLGLSDGDADALVAFLATLDGPGPDPALRAPPPPPLTAVGP